MLIAPEPAWLSTWRLGPVAADALRRFDGLPSVEADTMAERWRGQSLPTGHPLDGLLEALGRHGKAVEDPDHVHPLLFRRASGRVVALEPALMPVRIALAWPTFARGRVARAALAALGPILQARGPGVHLRVRAFRGNRGAALVYRAQPIVNHLRHVGDGRVLGLMECGWTEAPFFFLLERDAGK